MDDRVILNDEISGVILENDARILQLPHTDVRHEIEVRFMLDGQHNIPEKFYLRLFDIYDAKIQDPSKKQKSKTIVESRNIISRDQNRLYKTKRKVMDWKNNVLETEYKYRYMNYTDKYDYDVVIGVAAEFPAPESDKNKLEDKKSVRKRRRVTFQLQEGIQLDMTEIFSSGEVVSREVELEINDASNLNLLQKWTDIIWRDLHGSEVIYTKTMRYDMVRYFENLMNESITYGLFNNARQLHFRDIVYGGLVGCINKRYNKDDGVITYSASHKTDGERKLFIVHSSRAWLISPNFVWNLIEINPKLYENLNGVMMDVEYVPLGESRLKGAPTTKYWLHTIDLLCNREESTKVSDVRPNNRGYRTEQLYRLVDNYVETVRDKTTSTPNVEFFKKNNNYFRTPEEFFLTMRNMYNQRKVLTFKTDGIIFTPGETPYKLTDVEDSVMDNRMLTMYPDICKWKQADEITIDLLYDNDKVYAVEDGDKNKQKEKRRPRKNVELFGYKVLEGTEGVINEFSVDVHNKQLTMVRLRTEKPKPNRIGVVLDDIKAIRENIDIADLTGNSIKLAFKYHNRIKQLLISKLVKQDAYVLEVGLGRFGDMAKYEAAKVGGIYGVEPNTENIKEAKSRIKNNKYMKDRVQIIKAGGEDSDLIVEEVGSEADPKDRVDVVSLMLSLSFFYKSEKLLDGLVETIARTLSPNGKIIFMTIDGDAVNELAHSTIRTELAPKKKVMFGDDNYIVLPDQKSREVEIKLSGTILADVEGEQVEGKQTEWLVILGVFTAKLRKHGFILKEVYQADGEKLLSEDAQKFSRLYCYGYYERDNSGIKYLKGKEEKPKVEKKEKKTKERKEEWTVVSEYDGEVLEKWNDQYVLFGGLSTASKAGRLSILDLAYPIQFSTTETFNVDGNEEMDYKWLNVSQYIEATKADTFKDRTVFDAILSEKRPKNYHILARKIKRYDPDIWGDIEQSVVSRAIKHKFGVKEAREHLVDTGERQIVYTHPYDLQYGAGVSIDGFTTDYPGANYLGDILMTRREKLLRGMSKSD